MVMLKHVFLAFIVAQIGLAFPRVQLEPSVSQHDSAVSSWRKGVRASNASILTLTVAVRVDEERRNELERVFWEVSDPDHANYGKHRSVEEITKMLAVPKHRIALVREHFLSAGAVNASVAPNGDTITVTMSVADAEAALDTTFHLFAHVDQPDVQILRASRSYSLPSVIAKEVVMVGELLQFPALQRKGSQTGGNGTWANDCSVAQCHGLITPGVIAKRYKLPNTSIDASNGSNRMAVAEFQSEYYEPADLKHFSDACHRDATVATTIGGDGPSSPGIIAELDIEYIKSVAPEIPLTVVYSQNYSLLTWINQISSLENSPQVHSLSYGNDEDQQTSKEYMSTVNTAFMKAGVRGISILVASGDFGVCGREGCGTFKFRFKPEFPASSPYITSVGGTDFASNPPTIGDESGWQYSGGGFSNSFDRPDFQKEAVAKYTKNPDANLPPQTYWNANGRAYPDLAALGGTKTPYCIATDYTFTGVAGTGGATAVIAGIFAKLNGVRLAGGKPVLGFLNPFLYKYPTAFQDVTAGVNNGGRKFGFTAVKGWDAVSGLGTPDYEALAKVVMGAEVLSEIDVVV